MKPSINYRMLQLSIVVSQFVILMSMTASKTQAQWSTNGTNVYYNGGNVGIGTSTPNKSAVSKALTVNGSTDAIYELAIGETRKATLYHDGTDLSLNNNANGMLKFGTNNTFRVFINSGGNVGIGTTSPAGPLDVRDSSGKQILWNMASAGDSFLNANGGSVHVAANLYFNGTNWNRFNTAAAGGMWWAGNDGTLQVLQASAGANPVATFTSPFFINASGNVGIGTTTPSSKLHLVSGTDTATSLLSLDTGHGGTSMVVYGTANNESGFDMSVYRGGQYYSRFGVSNSGNVYLQSGGGNVGIGTATPSSLLHLYSAGNTYMQVGAPLASQSSISLSDDSYGQDIILYRPQNTRDFSIWTAGSSRVVTVTQSGNVGIGTTAPTAKLDVTGSLNVSGTVTGGNIVAKYQDVAEWVPSSEQLAAGTVVVLDSTKSNQVVSSSESYDTRVAGVISEQPGITLGEGGNGKVLVATTGRVRVKVDASRGPIHVGDLLVTSDIPGMAMKSVAVNLGGVQLHRPGTLIGKALEPLEKGSGSILVLLSLQ